MDPELMKRFEAQEVKLAEIYASLEKLRKYFKWTLIITVLMVVLPLVGLAFAIPQFLSLYSSSSLGF